MQEEDFCIGFFLNSGQKLFLLALQLDSETMFKLKKLIYYPSSFLQFCDLEWIPSCVCVCVCVWSWVENFFCCFEREIFWVEILWKINLSLITGDHKAKKNKRSQPAAAAAVAVGPFVDEKATRRTSWTTPIAVSCVTEEDLFLSDNDHHALGCSKNVCHHPPQWTPAALWCGSYRPRKQSFTTEDEEEEARSLCDAAAAAAGLFF